MTAWTTPRTWGSETMTSTLLNTHVRDNLNYLYEHVHPRILTITSAATPSIDTDSYNRVTITALAANITSMTTGLSGTPENFQQLEIRIKDNGTARSIVWGSSFEANGAALPTTTVINKRLTIGLEYDSVTSKWGCLAVNQEA